MSDEIEAMPWDSSQNDPLAVTEEPEIAEPVVAPPVIEPVSDPVDNSAVWYESSFNPAAEPGFTDVIFKDKATGTTLLPSQIGLAKHWDVYFHGDPPTASMLANVIADDLRKCFKKIL